MTTTDEKVIYCARHPKTETAITCSNCGTPICPKCMVVAPVGLKCPDCGKGRSVVTQIAPARFGLAAVVSVLAGIVAAVLGNIAFFFIIFLAIPYGYFAGGMILRASGMKRGLRMEVLTGVGMVLGALGWKLLPVISRAPVLAEQGYSLARIAAAHLVDPFFLIAVTISVICAVSKIRYL